MGYRREMRSLLPSGSELRELAGELEDAVERGVDEARAWLISDRGRRYRTIVAGALVLAGPVILRHPIFRTPLGKIVGMAGGAALVAKVADLIRDWEPATAPRARSHPVTQS